MRIQETNSLLANIVRLLDAESHGPGLYEQALREFLSVQPSAESAALYLALPADGARPRLGLVARYSAQSENAPSWPESVSENELTPGRPQDGSLALARIYEGGWCAGIAAVRLFPNETPQSVAVALEDLTLGLKILIREQGLISALHAAETKVRKAEQGAVEAEAMVFNVIHDMKAPLRVLQGYAAALHEDFKERLPEEASSYVSRIHGAAGSLETLLQGLLDYSRALLGEYRIGPVNPARILAEVLTSLESVITKRNADVESPEPLPSVMADAATLRSVMRHIIENGLKFTQTNRRPHIRISSAETEQWVRIFFDDDGIGVPKDASDKIFGLFERLHGRESYAGAGIGLALVRKALLRMGGSCGVESRSGEPGSRFWIELRKPPGPQNNS